MDKNEIQRVKARYNIIGNCDALNRAIDVALQVAPTDLSVLIVGESGVGKETLPRIIHDNSPRKHGKYFAINCGSIPEGTIDSELFGHEKGSFTGAIGESEGYFGIANNGTLFLDEVGELPLATQARLLRVLETGEYIRVGGQEIRKTNVRIVAATNVNMQRAISERRFREDLYYRLNTIPIQMPPLRERGRDILLLFAFFAREIADKYQLPGRITLTPDAEALMLKYKWPGNVRQLKNLTEQMSIMSERREIDADILSQFIPHDRETTQLATIGHDNKNHQYENERELLFKILYELQNNMGDMRRELTDLRQKFDDQNKGAIASHGTLGNLPSTLDPIDEKETNGTHRTTIEEAEAEEISDNESLNLDDMVRQNLVKALERHGGNRKKAAQELGISDRTLYRRLKQYGLE